MDDPSKDIVSKRPWHDSSSDINGINRTYISKAYHSKSLTEVFYHCI